MGLGNTLKALVREVWIGEGIRGYKFMNTAQVKLCLHFKWNLEPNDF